MTTLDHRRAVTRDGRSAVTKQLDSYDLVKVTTGVVGRRGWNLEGIFPL
jgi:hypothetical protein